jgi:hypothetical protein
LAMRQRLAVAVLIGTAACSSSESAESAGGSLVVEWTGADTGKLSAPAVAEWCDSLKLLELRAIHGDTGIALVVYPSDSITSGEYTVVQPAKADSSRPAAAAALRWFAETSIRGFRGDSGRVVLQSIRPGVVGGQFSIHFRAATEGSRISALGAFSGLTVTPAAESCAGRPAHAPEEGEEEEEEPFADGESEPALD